jgi:hypothetical protein
VTFHDFHKTNIIASLKKQLGIKVRKFVSLLHCTRVPLEWQQGGIFFPLCVGSPHAMVLVVLKTYKRGHIAVALLGESPVEVAV